MAAKVLEPEVLKGDILVFVGDDTMPLLDDAGKVDGLAELGVGGAVVLVSLDRLADSAASVLDG